MSYRGLDNGYTTMLSRRGHASLSPPRHRQVTRYTPYQPGSSKYNYLSHTTNETQQVLKEIISTERKLMHNWPNRGYGGASHSFGETTYGLFHQNFAQQPTRAGWSPAGRVTMETQARSPYHDTMKFGKSYIRNRSFDPVLGQVRQFETPTGIFQALGTNKADFSAWSGLHRAPSIAHFQSTLRR